MVSPMMGFDTTSPSIPNYIVEFIVITNYLPFTKSNHTRKAIIWALMAPNINAIL